MPFPNNCVFLRPRSAAFSLLELLVVLAFAGVVLGVSLPAVNSIGRGRDLSKSAQDLAALLDLARAHARSHNVRVEVGFASDASGLHAAVISAREGANFTPVSRVRHFPGVRLASVEGGGRPAADLVLGESRPGSLPSFVQSGLTFDHVLEFNSRGEARAVDNELVRCIEIGLLPNVAGTTPGALTKNFRTVQVAGLSGGVAVFAP